MLATWIRCPKWAAWVPLVLAVTAHGGSVPLTSEQAQAADAASLEQLDHALRLMVIHMLKFGSRPKVAQQILRLRDEAGREWARKYTQKEEDGANDGSACGNAVATGWFMKDEKNTIAAFVEGRTKVIDVSLYVSEIAM